MYYPSIGKIEYKGPRSHDPFAFKFYASDRVVGGKTMAEHLKFAMGYWYTMCYDGNDSIGGATSERSYNGSNPIQVAKNRAEAAFELMEKLGIEYFCARDRDIAPRGETLEESNANLDEMASYIKGLMDKTGIKLLWGAANLEQYHCYMSGAVTSPNAQSVAVAAAQLKKAVDITHQLGGQSFVFESGREGYNTILNTNYRLELDNMAYMMTLVSDYGRSIGFEGDFCIEPKPRDPLAHYYNYDVSTALGLFRRLGLEYKFKINVEAGHANLAGHSFQHELRVACDNDVLCSVDASMGSQFSGWDVDSFPTNRREAVLCMYEILRNGGFKRGGLCFDAALNRTSSATEDIFLAYISGMDTFAYGLLVADKIIEDGLVSSFIDERYGSFSSGIGKKIVDHEVTLEELNQYALTHSIPRVRSERHEYIESIINNYMTYAAADEL